MAKVYSKEEAQRHCDRINDMLGGWFREGAPLKAGMPGTKGSGPEAPDTSKLSAGELTDEQAEQVEREGGVMTILPPQTRAWLNAPPEEARVPSWAEVQERLRQDLMQRARERRARKRRKLQK
jgi:hypothetical protein